MHLSFKPINDNTKKGPVLQRLYPQWVLPYGTVTTVLQAWERKPEGKVLKLGRQILTPKYCWWYTVGIYLINQQDILREHLMLFLASLCSHRVFVKHYRKLVTNFAS